MTKTILKEIVIIILLLLAVILVLGVLLYDYIPTAKQVPSKVVSYTLDEETNEELGQTLSSQNIIKTYTIESSDLTSYEYSSDYDKGKKNPFADTTSTINTTTNNSTITNNTTQTNTLFNSVSGK